MRTTALFRPITRSLTRKKQQEKNGELVISYGSDEVEDQMFQSVLWEQDGVTYLISGFDTGLDAQTMFDMAADFY